VMQDRPDKKAGLLHFLGSFKMPRNA